MSKFGTGSHYKKYKYTILDVARVTGRKPGTIRNDVCNNVVDLNDFDSVIEYVKNKTK